MKRWITWQAHPKIIEPVTTAEHYQEYERKQRLHNLSDSELIRILTCQDSLPHKIDFWIHNNLHFLWRILNWNWFCLGCGLNHFPPSEKECMRLAQAADHILRIVEKLVEKQMEAKQ